VIVADILSKLKGTLSGAFKKGGQSVLGVDVSSSTIKVVQMREKGGRAVLETYGELALGPYAGIAEGRATQLPVEKMSQALKDLMVEAKVSTKECGVAIPLSASLINHIAMPDVGERRLKEMIPIEMRKYIPVAISEVLLDWRIIPKKEELDVNKEGKEGDEGRAEKTDVLVVAIHRETIDRYQKIVSGASLVPSFFEIEVFSTIRAALDGTQSPALVIDMGAGTTKIYIVEHRVLRQSHIINRGSQDITIALSKSLGISSEKARELKHMYGLLPEGAEPGVKESISLVLDGILAEAARVLNAYQRRYGRSVGWAAISGGGAGLKGLREAAEKALETSVVIANPFAKVATPAFLEDVLKEAGPEFAVAVGVALRKLEEQS